MFEHDCISTECPIHNRVDAEAGGPSDFRIATYVGEYFISTALTSFEEMLLAALQGAHLPEVTVLVVRTGKGPVGDLDDITLSLQTVELREVLSKDIPDSVRSDEQYIEFCRGMHSEAVALYGSL